MYRFINEKGEHLHELDGKPLIGTSTVVGVMAKPLTWWASGLAVQQLGWVKKADPRKSSPAEVEENGKERMRKAIDQLDQFKTMFAPDYIALLDKAYRAHADSLTKSADKGTDMHAELEAYVKFCLGGQNPGQPLDVRDEKHEAVKIFAKWALENVKRFIASEVYCYSERLWTGGITDCIFEDKQGRTAIMDFKSSKEAYFSQFLQIAGYDIAISENGIFDATGNPIQKVDEIQYYAVFPFGMENPEPQFHFDTAGAKQGFEAATVLYKLINNN
jgi:hypothetical protein